MLRTFFFYFWPVLIPITLYVLWFLWARHEVEEGQDPLKWTEGPWLITLVATFLIALLCFIPIIRHKVVFKGDSYVPARYEDGKLVPGKIE